MRDDRRAARHLRRGHAREGEQRARVRGHRPVPVLVLGLERGADDAGRRVVDEHVERAERRDLLEHARRRDVAADEHGLRAERRDLRRRLLGRAVVAEVADRDARRAERGEAERDRPADPARAARDEDGRPLEVIAAAGADPTPGAALGIVSQPSRVRGSRCAVLGLRRGVAEPVEQLHLLLAVAADLVVGGQVVDQLSIRARSWYAKCGVAGPTSASMSSRVTSATARSVSLASARRAPSAPQPRSGSSSPSSSGRSTSR